MPVIKCPDGIVRSYADFEDNVKPLWKEQMVKEWNDDKVRKRMYKIRKILSEFWNEGLISSHTSANVINHFPPELKEL